MCVYSPIDGTTIFVQRKAAVEVGTFVSAGITEMLTLRLDPVPRPITAIDAHLRNVRTRPLFSLALVLGGRAMLRWNMKKGQWEDK